MAETETRLHDIEAIRAWLRTCPYIVAKAPFTVDYLDDDPTKYAIYSVPSAITYKRDILGNVYEADVQTKTYYFSVSMPASEDAGQMADNLKTLDQVIDWMGSQNAAKNLPQPERMRVKSLVPTLTPYALQPHSNVMIYRISIQMTYRKE